MKKLLLLGAIGLCGFTMSAQETTTYYQGLPVSSIEDLTDGLYMISAQSNGDEGMLQASNSFVGNIISATKDLKDGTTDAKFIWEITKNEDNTIVVKNVGTEKYIPNVGSTDAGKGNINAGTTDVASAAQLTLNNISNNNLSVTNFGKRWALVKANNNASYQDVHVHCNGGVGSYHFSYWPGGANHGTGSAVAAVFYHVSETELAYSDVTFNFGDGVTTTASLPVGYTISASVDPTTSDNVVRIAALTVCPFGASISPLTEAVQVAESGTVVSPTATFTLPITAGQPYRVRLRATDSAPHPVYYTGSVATIRDHADVANELNPNSLWYFKSTGYESGKGFGFTMHSLSADDNQGMKVTAVNSNTGISLAAEPTKFYILKSTYSGAQATDFCLRAEGGDNWYVNEYQGNANGGKNFAIWNSSGALSNDGSVMRVVALTDADFDDHQSWTTTDGITKYFESNAKAAAKASKTVADLRTLFATVAEDMTYGQACDALTTYSATKVSKLTATTLFSEAEAQAVISAAASIDENAENFETALAEAKDKVDAIDVNVEATKKLNGRKVIIRNIAGANGTSNLNYITGVATGETVNTTLLSPAAVWSVTVNEEDNTFVLRNLVKENYLGNLQAAEEGVAFRLANNGVSSNNANAFAIQNPSQSGNNFLNNNATTNETLRYFSAGSGNASSFWTITFADDQEAAWLTAATANYVADIEIGNEPSQYKVTDPDYATKAALCAQVEVDGEVNYPVLAQLVENPITGEAPVLFDIHSITGPALVRIKTSAQSTAFTANGRDYDNTVHYLSNTTSANNGNKMALITNGTGDETIFVLENVDGSALISTYLGGEYGIDRNGFLGLYGGNDELSANTGLALTFNAASEGAASEKGAYYISHALSGNNKSHVTMWGSGDTAFADRYSGTNPGRVYAQNVNVEYVKTLSLNFDSYTLWRTPVAIQFASDADAYTIVAEGINITTVAVDSENVYPAGTAFLMNGAINLTVHNNMVEASQAKGTLGHHAIKAHSVEAGKVVLTVAPADTPSPANELDALPTVKMAVSIPTADEERTLAAHDVLVVADNDEKKPTSDGKTILVTLGGTTTTEIVEITEGINAAAEGAVYDLQGRRLAAPVKGINIINGKKVLVK